MSPLEHTHARIRESQRLALLVLRKTPTPLVTREVVAVELASRPRARWHQVWPVDGLRELLKEKR